MKKPINEPLDPEKGQKEEATRKKFELLRFGDTQVNKMNKVYIVKNALVFMMQLD